jgi:chorismate mutase/prephenate dehydratase
VYENGWLAYRSVVADTAPTPDLSGLRTRIDEIDGQIARLLQERASISLEVGRAKGNADRAPIFVPEREAQVLKNVADVEGPLPTQAIHSIYREILSSSRALQRPLRIAHLGPAATFGHEAAQARFGAIADFEPCATHAIVFETVEKGAADYGVVAFENSTEGPVTEVLDRMVDSPLRICAEVGLPISHNLVSKATSLSDIRRVLAHPQAAGQCRTWLSERLPGVSVEAAASNGRAAELAADDPHAAAIAPRIATAVYGLNLLEEGIQDLAGNFTRFVVVGRSASQGPSGRDKTAVVFSIKDRVGALRDMTNTFAKAEVNMSSIQSRPSKRRAWDYWFFVELDGHQAEPRVGRALRAAEEHTVFLKVLGSWPVTD